MMSENLLPKAYAFQDVEARWSAFWEQNNCWTANPDSPKPPFSIVIPPPNVTGQLHMGHALNITLQDILCRYHRLKGFEVLWIPGTDHAGIATQNVVERELIQEGLSRHQLGREAFVERVWGWKQKYGGIIINQLKRLGASCDWSRERFTMDEGLSRAVRMVFIRLYEEGLIYRGQRMINWCPRCMTALANIEVDWEELDSYLYFIRYPSVSGKGGVVVATTRPETMLGDTAVAVHPEDPRHKPLIGQKVMLPLVERPIPVIGDTYVDREFGTGALKVTPAHDFNDFEIGRKHQLELVRVIGENGCMTEAAGTYAGMDRQACRKRILKDLERGGYLVKTEPYRHRVGHCYRCKSAVEPMQSLQWFVKTRTLADRAIAAVQEGETRIVPTKWEKDYFIWLENLEDWCISRQIWWGHRIPAWYCRECGEITVSQDDPTSCRSCRGTNLEQDLDVLDTWFSSALWPFSTMGWPEQTAELKKFYPTSVLVTAFDILYFWVARMMMMGLHFMGEVPFRDVYVHALVRDAQGQKMSKSKGNVIDPVDTMDQYGTDALRFTLAAFAVQGRDVKLSEERIEGYKHFINKIWNAARLLLMNLEGMEALDPIPARPARTVHRWILSRVQRVIEGVQSDIEGYHFNQYANAMYQFVWHEFCDWYLEIIKQDIYGEDPGVRTLALSTAAEVLKNILILLHPLMPFVTEEIWQRMPRVQGSLAKASIPSVDPERLDPEAEEEMELIMAVINGIRNIRGEMNIPPAARVDAVCIEEDSRIRMLLKAHETTICEMARLASLQVGSSREIPKPRVAAGTMAKSVEVYVLLKDILDFDSESARLRKELAKLEREYSFTLKKLSNEDFLQKAPSDVIERERDKGTRLGKKLEKLRSHFERIRTIQADASAVE